jgi:hypothetical protein
MGEEKKVFFLSLLRFIRISISTDRAPISKRGMGRRRSKQHFSELGRGEEDRERKGGGRDSISIHFFFTRRGCDRQNKNPLFPQFSYRALSIYQFLFFYSPLYIYLYSLNMFINV